MALSSVLNMISNSLNSIAGLMGGFGGIGGGVPVGENEMSYEFLFRSIKQENQPKLDRINIEIAELENYVRQLEMEVIALKALISALKAVA